jgi:hypothetical protein
MPSKAKKHPILSGVTDAISGRLPEVVEEVLGVRYKLRLLKPEAEDWVANNTPGATVSAALLNSRKPTLAAALVSISRRTDDLDNDWDEVPVESLFTPQDDMDPGFKDALARDPKLMREWRREQVLEWMREEQDVYVIDKLYDAYSKLIPRHKEAMQAVSGF